MEDAPETTKESNLVRIMEKIRDIFDVFDLFLEEVEVRDGVAEIDERTLNGLFSTFNGLEEWIPDEELGVTSSADVVVTAIEYVKKLEAIVSGKFSDVRLIAAGPGDKGFGIEIGGGPLAFFAEYMAEMLGHKSRPDPLNFVTVEVTHPELGMLVLTLQRAGGKTPSSRIGELEALLRQCQDGLYDDWRHDVTGWASEMYEKIENALKK